jgi:hypothetical protein
MKNIYIVWLTTINENESSRYSSGRYESIQGVYDDESLAIDKIDKLYDEYKNASFAHPEYNYIRQECRIEVYKLNL